MEEKVLFNTLNAIGTGREDFIAPDGEYLKSLEKIGLIKTGWDSHLTALGKKIKNLLADEIYKY